MVEITELDLATISKMLKEGELIEVPIVARKLQRSESTIRLWLDEGKVDGVRIGGRRYVVKKSLDEFLCKNTMF